MDNKNKHRAKNTIKRYMLSVLLAVLAFCVSAQEKDDHSKFRIMGQVIEMGNYDPIERASVQLFSKDSTFLSGALTNEKGNFTLYTDKKGDYQVNISFVGSKTLNKKFTIYNKTTLLGTMALESDSIVLDEAVVTGNLPKMQMVGDTLMFNADAYHMPEGAVLEELIQKLPGAEVDDNGNITINGKQINKILLDGKEFFVGNNAMATKNLPTDIIDKLKVYDEKSDQARVTGIDDGVENPVIDIKIKKNMNMGYMFNGDAGYGTHDRYSGRITFTEFTAHNRLAAILNGSNTGGSRGGRRGGGGGSQGLRSDESVGANYNYDDGTGSNGGGGRGGRGGWGGGGSRDNFKLKIDGNTNWEHGTTDRQQRQSSTNYEKVGATTYSNSLSKNLSKNHGWNASMRLEWKPDSVTNIQFRPSWSIRTSDSMSESQSMQFSANPFEYTDTPLDLYHDFVDSDSIRTNRRVNRSMSHSTTKRLGGSLQYNHRFGDMGRNLNLRIEGNYSESDRQNVSNNNTHLYKVMDQQGNDSVFYTNRYSTTPDRNKNFSANVSYSEPLMRNTFLQFTYTFRYSKDESDQKTYDFSALGEQFGAGADLAYGNFDAFIGGYNLPDYLNESLSRYSYRENFDHDAQLLFRIIRTYYNFSTGVQWRPQRSHTVQDYHGIHTDTIRVTNNFNPTMNLQLRFSRNHTLKLDYHGNSSQPSINQLIDITDDANPMNIVKGNPGLKPSWTNNLNLNYNNYFMTYKQTITLNWNWSRTSNSIANKMTYDDRTGGRITQPVNISGNWRTGGNLQLGTALDQDGKWFINSNTRYNYNHQLSYLSQSKADSRLNTTNNQSVNERLSGSYRNDWLDVEINGSTNYSHVRNLLQPKSNRDTWQFNYGASVNIKFPWHMTFDTNINQRMYRGYNDATANRNELIWNAEISQQILSRRRLILSLQVFDILGQQRTFDYNVGDTRTSETHYNSITQYFMLHAVFNIRQFGGKAAREARRERRMREGGEAFGEALGGFGPPEGRGGFGGGEQGGNRGGNRGGGGGRGR